MKAHEHRITMFSQCPVHGSHDRQRIRNGGRHYVRGSLEASWQDPLRNVSWEVTILLRLLLFLRVSSDNAM